MNCKKFSLGSKLTLPQQNPGYAHDQDINLIRIQAEASGQNLHFLDSFNGSLRTKFYSTVQARNRKILLRGGGGGGIKPKVKIQIFQKMVHLGGVVSRQVQLKCIKENGLSRRSWNMAAKPSTAGNFCDFSAKIAILAPFVRSI